MIVTIYYFNVIEITTNLFMIISISQTVVRNIPQPCCK